MGAMWFLAGPPFASLMAGPPGYLFCAAVRRGGGPTNTSSSQLARVQAPALAPLA